MSLKLTSEIHAEIRPDATVDIPVREMIIIPAHGVIGKFFIRLSLARKSLNSPDCKFRAGWSGKSSIVLHNSGPNIVYIREGDELGELDLLPTIETERRAIEVDLTDAPIPDEILKRWAAETDTQPFTVGFDTPIASSVDRTYEGLRQKFGSLKTCYDLACEIEDREREHLSAFLDRMRPSVRGLCDTSNTARYTGNMEDLSRLRDLLWVMRDLALLGDTSLENFMTPANYDSECNRRYLLATVIYVCSIASSQSNT